MKKILFVSMFLFCISIYAETIRISCGSQAEQEMCAQYAHAWGKQQGHLVEIVTAPANPTDRLAIYQQLLSSHSDRLDIYMIDVIWPAILAKHAIDLMPYLKQHLETHFPTIIANNTVQGKLIGLPWFTDAGLLYYRKDLLEKYKQAIPKTWKELEHIATVIQQGERKNGNPDIQGYVWQGKAYEGLTCNALEWIASWGGGRLVEADGRISILNPQTLAALEQAKNWIGTISPRGVLTYTEEEARGIWQKGNAIFMRNWPYAYFLSEHKDSAIAGKIGVTTLPGYVSNQGTGVLGGWQLMVSKYSKHPELAAELASYLTSAPIQRERALKYSLLPTYPHLYEDPELQKIYPFLASMKTTLLQAVARPSSITRTEYNKVSVEFFNAVHAVLSRKTLTKDALAALDQKLQRLKNRW